MSAPGTIHIRMVIRTPRCRAEPHVPVNNFRIGLWFRRQPVVAIDQLVDRSVDGMNFSQLPGLREFGGVAKVGNVAALCTRLEDATGPLNRFLQSSCQLNGDRTGFFRVDIFAGFGCHHGSGRMPAVTRGNQDGVDIIAGQQFAEVAIGVAFLVAVLFVGHLFDGLALISANIGDSDEADIGLLKHVAQHITATSANADPSQNNPFAGSHGSVQAQRRCRDNCGCREYGTGGGCRLHEVTTIESTFLRHLFLLVSLGGKESADL